MTRTNREMVQIFFRSPDSFDRYRAAVLLLICSLLLLFFAHRILSFAIELQFFCSFVLYCFVFGRLRKWKP
ncbi:hypothetical protein MUK42_31427 [Musa troglodytarum]|uniref:Uncharacterized protein n=1 Tax=Musa troglodytarum TaxID=320322 RepID=A0A9E7FJW2_9LILI|nr:hypothetical protein MUK42_31427 [Musa troglodytarum]